MLVAPESSVIAVADALVDVGDAIMLERTLVGAAVVGTADESSVIMVELLISRCLLRRA